MFKKYNCNGYLFDIGNTTQLAINEFIKHFDTSTCGQTDYYHNGNGSLMRMLPLAFVDCDDDDVRDVSALTHAHSISTNTCIQYVRLTKRLIETKDIKTAMDAEEFERLRNCPESDIPSSGFVVDTFEAAKWCLVNSKSYKECVLKAVNLGCDTDTIAAIAGGWAGIVYGYESIPLKWRLLLRNKKLINQCMFEVA